MTEIADGHFEQQSPIDAYGNGGFRFAEMSHVGSLLCLPSGMHKWHGVTSFQDVANNLDQIWQSADDIDVFLLGTGDDIVFVDEDTRQQFRDRKIILEPMSTGAAVRTYNILLGEKRAVAAGLISVERAK